MQSDTDDADTDIEDPKLSKPSTVIELNASVKCESVSSKSPKPKISKITLPEKPNILNQPKHSVKTEFSDQTECKLQQPRYTRTNTPKLLEQSTTPKIDDDDDDALLNFGIFKRNESRNIPITSEENGLPQVDLQKYRRKKRSKKRRDRKVCECAEFVECPHCSLCKECGLEHRRSSRRSSRKRHSSKSRERRSSSKSRRRSSRSRSRSKSKERSRSRSKSKSKSRNGHKSKRRHSANVNLVERDQNMQDADRPRSKSNPKGTKKKKRYTDLIINGDDANENMIISSEYFNKSLPQLPQEKNHCYNHHHNCSPHRPSVPAEIHVAQPLILPMDAFQNHTESSPASPMEDNWKYPSRPRSARNPIHHLLTDESFMINRSHSSKNIHSNTPKRQSDVIPFKKKYYNKALPMHKRRTLPTQKYHEAPSMDKQSTAPILNYYNSPQSGYNPYFDEQIFRQSASSMSPPLHNAKFKAMRMREVAWDKPFELDRTKACTLIWGKAINIKYPEWIHSDNLSQKNIYNVSVAKEGGHCFGIGTNDWCFVWGQAMHSGVLGLGTNAKETSPFLLRSLRKERVKQTSCSALHSLAITENLIIYGWGSKQLTLLGTDTNTPTPLQFLNGKGLRELSACNTHSLCWNSNSINIYSFGISGDWLGYDEQDSVHRSTFGTVKFDRFIYSNNYKVIAADCSAEYSIIVLNTGYVGSCGVNEHGRMAVGKEVMTSSKVLWNKHLSKIVKVSAATFHSGFVDINGRVFTCGVGNDYRLGHGSCDTLFDPKMVDAVSNMKIRQIECVDSRTYVITTAGHLVVWGREPMNGKVHQTPFHYNQLNDFRIFNVNGSKDFCVINGVPMHDDNESKSSKIPGIAKLVTVQKKSNNNISTGNINHSKHQINAQKFERHTSNKNKIEKRCGSKMQIYNHRKIPKTDSRRSPKAPLLDILQSNDLKKEKTYFYGKCNQSGCSCTKFVACSSKWSKGKCKYCNHKKEHHKK